MLRLGLQRAKPALLSSSLPMPDRCWRNITADRVLDILTNLFLTRGVPRHIRSDNGPEFIASAIRRHVETTGLKMLHIEPGSLWENGFAEIVLQPAPRRVAERGRVHKLDRSSMVREASASGT